MKLDQQNGKEIQREKLALVCARAARTNANTLERASSSMFAIALASALLLALQ